MATVPTMTAVVCDRYGPPEVLRVCQVQLRRRRSHPHPDRRGGLYPLDSIVEAHRFVEAGHKRGGVAASIQQP